MNNWFNRLANEPRIRAARQAAENLPPGVRRAAQAGATGAAVGVAVFAIPPLLGFTAAGVAAGSVAAVIQSAVYGAAVPAGSFFAIMQSVGATATIVPAIIAATTTAAGAAAASGGEHDDMDPEEPGEDDEDVTTHAPRASGNEKYEGKGPEEVNAGQSQNILVVDPIHTQDGTNDTINCGVGGQELVRPRNNVC